MPFEQPKFEVAGPLEKEKILEKLGIEKDSEGKFILYHATAAKNYFEIEKDSAIRPAKETGRRAWRLRGEEEPEKVEKIYLATKEKAKHIASLLQNEGGSIYILEVHIDEKNLRPDEDTREDNWYDSLWAQKTCSHLGRIGDYNPVEKLDFELPGKVRREYFERSIEAKSPEEKEKIRKEYDDLKAQAKAEEEEELRKILKEKEKIK